MKLLKNPKALILLSAIFFGLGGVCIKQIPWAATSINGARCAMSGLMIFIYLKATGGKLKFTKGVFLGAFCAASTTLLYTFANKLTTAANAILIQYASPLYIILFMWIFFKERPRRLDIIASVFIFGGIACFVMDGLGTGRMLGNILALISGVTFAGVFMVNRFPGGDSFSATILGHAISAVIGLPSIVKETNFEPRTLLFVVILGVFQMGLGYLCFCIGIKKVEPITASLLSGVEPIVNPLLVAIVVGEMLSPIAAVGGIVVLGSVTVYNILLSRIPVTEDLEAVQAAVLEESVQEPAQIE